MVEFVDASTPELTKATKFLHLIKPSLKNRLVCAIEKTQPFDQNVVFHLVKRKLKKDEERDTDDIEILMLSTEYILEHPFWRTAHD